MRPVKKEARSGPQAANPAPADTASRHPYPMFTQVLHGATLCELVVWSDEDWAKLPHTKRPELARHFPGLGWVCCVPVLNLN